MNNNIFKFWLVTFLFFSPFSINAQEVAKPKAEQLLNPTWMEAQLKEIGIDQLLAKYEDQTQKEVQLVRSALNLSAHVIRKHPQALRSQLQGRLVSRKEPLLQSFQTLPKGQVQIVATTSVLAQAGGPLVRSYSEGIIEIVFAGVLADGKQVVTLSKEGTIQFYQANSGKRIRTIETKQKCFLAKMSRDRQTLVAINMRGDLLVWDLAKGQLKHNLNGTGLAAWDVVLSHDGSKAVTRASNRTMICWDIKAGKKRHTFNRFQDKSNCLAISPDGKQVVTAKQYTYTIWNLETGEKINSILPEKRSGRPLQMVITKDGKHAVVNKGKTYELINLTSGQNVIFSKSYFPSFTFNHLNFSIEDEKIIASQGKAIQYAWDKKTGQLLKDKLKIPFWLNPLALSPQSQQIIVRGSQGEVNLYDPKIQFPSQSDGKSHTITCLKVSADEKNIMTGGIDTEIKVWDFKSLSLTKTITGHTGKIEALCITPDGKRIISGSADRTTRLWDLATGKLLKKRQQKSSSVLAYSLVASPDNKEVIGRIDQTQLGKWNLETDKVLNTHTQFRTATQVILSPEGKHIICAGYDNRIRTWDRNTFQLLSTIDGFPFKIFSMAMSIDGKKIMVGDDDATIRLWNTTTTDARITRFFNWHASRIVLVAFLAKGDLVLSGSCATSNSKVKDNSLRIWNHKTKQLITTFYLDSKLLTATLSPSGKYILAGTVDGMVHKFRIANLPGK